MVAKAALERRCGLILPAVDVDQGGAEVDDQRVLRTGPAAGDWSPARAQAHSRAAWRAWEIAAITAGVSSASVVSMRQIGGAEATSPNTPGSHRNRSVSPASSPPTASVIARASTTYPQRL